jgi:phenylalanyl-tRNA synthetase beta chain
MEEFVPFRSRTNRFEHISEFPENTFDISFLVDSMVKWDEIREAILGKNSEGSLLRDVLFIDEYKGRQIPAGKKSVTVRLVIGSNEKTLTGAEIESVADSVMRKITHKMGADIRSK